MRSLPLDYCLTNLLRKPLRTALAIVACSLATALVLGALAFSSALESSFRTLGRNDVAIVMGKSAENDTLRSEIDLAVGSELASGVRGVKEDGGHALISPEVTMGVDVILDGSSRPHPALLRGVTDLAYRLHPEVTILRGRTPGPSEAMVGSLAGERMGITSDHLAIGSRITIDGRPLTIVGHFTAPGSAIDAEIWTPLETLMSATRRTTISCLFVALDSAGDFPDVELFCRRRLDLELSALRTTDFYSSLARYFAPVRVLALTMAILIAIATFITGATTLAAIVRERSVEIATLRAIGYDSGAVARSILLEALVCGACGALLGGTVARFLLVNAAVPIAMTAVRLELDSGHIALGFLFTLTLCQIAALPALISALGGSIAAKLRRD